MLYFGCIDTIGSVIADMEGKTGRRGTIRIGIPGSPEPKSRLGNGASSTWLLGRPVETDLVERLGREVRVENDADCLAASEAVDGAGAGHNAVLAVILGSGAGAGIAVGGRAHHGPDNSGGEWGHNPLPFPNQSELTGRPCYLRQAWLHGHLGLGPRFEAEFALHTGAERKAAEIMEMKRGGDRLAGLLWSRYVDRVAHGLSIVVNALDSDIFVMGGGMSNVPELHDDLARLIARHTFSTVFHTPIVKSRHGDSGGVRGAAWLWKDG